MDFKSFLKPPPYTKNGNYRSTFQHVYRICNSWQLAIIYWMEEAPVNRSHFIFMRAVLCVHAHYLWAGDVICMCRQTRNSKHDLWQITDYTIAVELVVLCCFICGSILFYWSRIKIQWLESDVFLTSKCLPVGPDVRWIVAWKTLTNFSWAIALIHGRAATPIMRLA